ncbi:MAG TPA: hypothetical protein VFB62_06590 [Polyangiaceae bacterium]|nr:hypothetical protein [Polyangiaceae bacterium]
MLRLLRERQLELMVAVTPDRAADVSDVIKACHDAEVRVGLWPMLAHADGRWPNVHNAEAFAVFVHRLLEMRERADELAIDLEPPIHEFRALLALEAAIITHMLRRRGVKRGTAKLRELLAQLNGMPTTAAFVPMVLADRHEHGWQRFLGTPIAGLDFTRLSPMLYTSLFEGYSRGLLRRREAVALLDAGARTSARRFGARAGVSLGVIGSGILGDEPTYRDVSELAEDVSIARAAGIDDILVYSLDGVLARPPAEPWLDAIVDPPPPPPLMPSLRAQAVLAAIAGVSRVLSIGRLIRG